MVSWLFRYSLLITKRVSNDCYKKLLKSVQIKIQIVPILIINCNQLDWGGSTKTP